MLAPLSPLLSPGSLVNRGSETTQYRHCRYLALTEIQSRNSYTLQKEQLTFHHFKKFLIRYWDVLNIILYQSVCIKYFCFEWSLYRRVGILKASVCLLELIKYLPLFPAKYTHEKNINKRTIAFYFLIKWPVINLLY